MRVWLVQRSEPTPHDSGGSQRAMRIGILAQILAKSGHRVLWWTSTFNHFNRQHRHEKDIRLPVETDYTIQYLHGCGYSRNISLARLRDNSLVASRFSYLAEQDPELPDIILASMPTAELALAAVSYARKRDIPVLLDIRDLWPDIFFDLVSTALSPVLHLLTIPMERKLKKACAGANGIIGITDAFVDWGVAHAGRPRVDNDRVFPMGYLVSDIPADRTLKGRQFWQEMNVSKDNRELIAIFLGTLSKGFDFGPLIQAAKLLEHKHVPIKIIICGVGESEEGIKRQAKGLHNVFFPGWVNAEQIKVLLELADIGIAPYINRRDFIDSYPNKTAEYLSGGLVIALSLGEGALHDLLLRRECGFSYENCPEKLAAQFELLAYNPNHLKTLQVNAMTTFRESFDGVIVYTCLIKFMEQMVQIGLKTFSEK